MVNRRGKSGSSDGLYFLGLPNLCRWWLQPWNEKMLAPWKESYDKPRQHIKKQKHHFANKGLYSQSYGFSSSHIWMWELDVKTSECWRIDAFEFWCWRRFLRVPWTEGDQTSQYQPSIFIGMTDAEAEAPILWPPDVKSQLIGKDPDAGKDWRQKEKRAAEDKMVR